MQNSGRNERTESESSAGEASTNDSLCAFLEREGLGRLAKFFPADLTLQFFRSLTDDELEQDYNVRNDKDRAQLVRAIIKLRDEDSDDDEHETDSELHNSADSQSEVFMSTTLPTNFKLIQSRFRDDHGYNRPKRRESFAVVPSRFEETSNLVRMRNTPHLGKSEPNLSASSGDIANKRPSSFSSGRRAAKSFIGTSSVTHHRSFSPSSSHSSFTQVSDSPVGSPSCVLPNPTFASHFAFSNVRKVEGSNRRWSVASLTSSGYGTHTPCSSSYSSLASSQEKLHQFQAVPYAEDIGLNYNMPALGAESDQDEEFNSDRWSPRPRQRARSLSPPRSWCQQEDDLQALNILYKDRFPTAVKQMEEKISELLEEYSPDGAGARSGCDGVLHFVLHQVVEFARDVLKHSQEGSLTSGYFYELSENLNRLLHEARLKTDVDATPVKRLVRRLQLIVSRPSRLLECLEFSPEEFYSQLQVDSRELSTSENKPDITEYVKSMLNISADSAQWPADRDSPPPEGESGGGSMSSPKDAAEVPVEEDFQYIKLISNGAYGAVYLVRHKRTEMRFAMKKMNKQLMTHRNQVDQVFAERDILTFSDNPFVVGMWCCFETKKHLCMVMEYVEGGDCASLLKNMGPLPVDLARLYFAETVLAVEYLHSYGIIHRDIKPDNLLITAMGHIKLTDFGLSKIGLMSFTTHIVEQSLERGTKQFTDNQVLGTPDYVAPEVILRQGYGKPVDWWAMGIILYEFLVGVAPFYGDTPEELFAHTLSGDLEWPEGDEAPPEDAQDLVTRLLEQDPRLRLGTGGAIEVKEHRFFQSLDWTALLRQKAEFIPQLDDDEDTSYFDTRTDRYNHDLETDDDDDDDDDDDSLEFSNFSTCSPRYSRILSPGPVSPLSFEEKKDESNKSTSEADNQSSESSPPTVRRRSLKKKVSDFSDELSESRESDEEQPRRRSDSGISRDWKRQTSSSSSTPDSPSTPVQVEDTPDTPPTPPTVRQRKAAVAVRPSAGFSSAGVISESSSSQPASPAERTGERQTLTRTRSLPPVPRLELTQSDDETRVRVCSLDSPPLSPRPRTPTRSPSRRKAKALSLSLRPPIVIEKGPRGFGFTLQAIRVFYGDTNYYTVHHLVSNVEHGSAAFESGLRPGDLLTHVNDESIVGLTHRQVIEQILSGGNKLTLTATELAKTSIKAGGRKRQLSSSKRVKKRAPTRGSRRTAASPTLPSPPADQTDSPRNRGFWKRVVRSGSFTRSRSPSLRRTSSCKRMSTPEGKYHQPLSPKHGSPPFDFRNVSDHSSSSVGSSPASSPNSTGPHGTERPGSLHGIRPKMRSVRSPRRKTSAHVPVSPLARTPSPTMAPQSAHQPRSTSPLTVRCSPGSSPHFVTVPSSSPRPGSPLLRRALSPEHFQAVGGQAEGSRKSKAGRSRRISMEHSRSKSDFRVQRSRSLREEYGAGKPRLETRLFEQKRSDGGGGKARDGPAPGGADEPVKPNKKR